MTRRARRSGCAALLSLGLLCALAGSGGAAPAPAAFVALREVAPGVREEMRYATADNFVGEPIDGYRQPVCLLTRDAALALGRAQRRLAERGYGLRVYDCYRPQRAVDHFLRWAADPDDTRRRAEHYPRIPKERLFTAGYLAARSGHSRGGTVDVTLVRPGRGAVDMGTVFDFFDPRSHYASRAVGGGPRAARELLRSALVAEGFAPLETEWWHFTYRAEPFPATYFDFPVACGTLGGTRGCRGQRRRRSHPRGSRATAVTVLRRGGRRRGSRGRGLSPVRDIRAARWGRSGGVSRRRGGRRGVGSPGAGPPA